MKSPFPPILYNTVKCIANTQDLLVRCENCFITQTLRLGFFWGGGGRFWAYLRMHSLKSQTESNQSLTLQSNLVFT